MVETGPVSGFADVRTELERGNRVLLFVRHAERPRIDQEDPTFGAALPITENGKRMCEDFGAALKGASNDVQFLASPLRRTVMSARHIAIGMGLPDAEIPEDDRIGNGSAFIADVVKVWQLFRDHGFFSHMTEYMRNGVLDGFAPNGEAADAYEEYALSKFHAQLGVFSTHDVYIAAFLFARKVKTDWSPDNWPRFLDAAMVVLEPSGARRYALLRAGLSDLAVGVGAVNGQGTP